MIKGKLNDKEAKCPFFQCHTKDKIVCEGILPDTNDHIIFRRQRDKQIQYAVFCTYQFPKCERYQFILAQYEDEARQ